MKVTRSELFILAHKYVSCMIAGGWTGSRSALMSRALKKMHKLTARRDFEYSCRSLNKAILDRNVDVPLLTREVTKDYYCGHLEFPKLYQLEKAMYKHDLKTEEGYFFGKVHQTYAKTYKVNIRKRVKEQEAY